MAAKRLSPGVYEVNGKRIQASSAADAEKKAGVSKADKGKVIGPDKAKADKAKADAGKSETTKTAETVDEIIAKANEAGKKFADDYIPTGTFGGLEEGTSPEMRDFLDKLKVWSQTAGNLTGNEQKGLNYLESGLGGYLAPELQAMRELRLKELDSEVATQQRQAALQAARSGVRGPYAAGMANNINRQAVQTRGNLEQELFTKNADVVQQRKEAFANLVNQTEAARFGRQRDSNQMYGGALGGEESVQQGIKQYNNSQRTNEALARGGLATTGAGLWSGMFGNEQASDLSKNYFDFAKTQGERQHDEVMATLKQNREAMDRAYGRIGV